MDRIDFLLSPECNASCTYCFQKNSYRAFKHKKASKKIINDFVWFCQKQKVSRVDVFGGEPLFYKDLFIYLIKELRGSLKDIMIGIVTNGMLMDVDIINALDKYEVGVLLSLDGKKDRHDAYRTGFDRIFSWIPSLVASGAEVAMQLSRAKDMYSHVKYIWDLGFTDGVFINIVENFGWYLPGEDEIFENEYEKAVLGMLRGEGILSCAIKTFQALSSYEYSQSCGIVHDTVACDWEGFLFPCHRAMELGKEFVIGDIYSGIDEKKDKILRAKIFQEAFLLSQSAQKYPLVSLCPISVHQHNGRFDGEWPHEYAQMIQSKAKIVVKYYYEIDKYLDAIKYPVALQDEDK